MIKSANRATYVILGSADVTDEELMTSGIQEEGEKCPLHNIMTLDTFPSSRPLASMIPAFVPVAANIMSQGINEGNICKGLFMRLSVL